MFLCCFHFLVHSWLRNKNVSPICRRKLLKASISRVQSQQCLPSVWNWRFSWATHVPPVSTYPFQDFFLCTVKQKENTQHNYFCRRCFWFNFKSKTILFWKSSSWHWPRKQSCFKQDPPSTARYSCDNWPPLSGSTNEFLAWYHCRWRGGKCALRSRINPADPGLHSRTLPVRPDCSERMAVQRKKKLQDSNCSAVSFISGSNHKGTCTQV